MPPKSKPGEGIVVVIDVGPGVRASTEETFYAQAKKCLINILQRKLFAEKCKDLVGIVVFGTDETSNNLANADQYKHITVLQEPQLVDWDLVNVAEQLPRGYTSGDWLDALVIAMDLLQDEAGVLYSTKKIVLMTDFSGDFSDDQASTIVSGLKNLNIELTVIGPVIGDDDEGSANGRDEAGPSNGSTPTAKPGSINWNGKPKLPQQLAAEALLANIIAEVDGLVCSFDEALPQLIFFEKKSQSSSAWNAFMDIGPNFTIPITGRIKIKRSMPASWKRCYGDDENATIISETSHHKLDEERTVVENEDIISGYRYGTTLVPFGEGDEQLSYTCDAQGAVLSVLGFTKAYRVPYNMRAGDQVLIVTSKEGDEDGAFAISALVQAMAETNTVAVTRRVYRKGLKPVMGVLYPDITTQYQCFVWVSVPFAEDLREYVFPSLQKATQKLTDEQKNAMDTLISTMDLSSDNSSECDDDAPLSATSLVNPQLQHFFNCLTQRGLNPDAPLQPPQGHILSLLRPPSHLRPGLNDLGSSLSTLFPIVKMEKEKKTLADALSNVPNTVSDNAVSNGTQLSSLDLQGGDVMSISSVSPAEDFLAMLKASPANYTTICNELRDVVLQMVEGLGDSNANDAVLLQKLQKCLQVARREAALILPASYNTIITSVKQVVIKTGLRALWDVVAEDGLGLITSEESIQSTVAPNDASDFLTLQLQQKEVVTKPPQEDYDDMLDDL